MRIEFFILLLLVLLLVIVEKRRRMNREWNEASGQSQKHGNTQDRREIEHGLS
jgi:hypothetical protein